MRLSTFFAVLISAVLVVACATSPTGRRQLQLVSGEQLNEMGVTAFSQMKKEIPPAKNVSDSGYVRCVASAITGVLNTGNSWEVQVFESEDINAFALPGGKIGIYTGLLRKAAVNADQLAAVIGHEIAHVLAGHSGARVSNELAAQLGIGLVSATTGFDPQLIGTGANLLLLMPYGRADESEADELGLDYMARAGFNPAQAVDLWVNMGKASGGAPPEFLSTHPSNATRIADIQQQLPRVMPIYEQARRDGRRPSCSRG